MLINGNDKCNLVAKHEFYLTPVIMYELNDFYFEEEWLIKLWRKNDK